MGTNPLIDGGPARPVPAYGGQPPNPGMSLRDHFAAETVKAILPTLGMSMYTPTGFNLVAVQSYQVADAMILARAMPPVVGAATVDSVSAMLAPGAVPVAAVDAPIAVGVPSAP